MAVLGLATPALLAHRESPARAESKFVLAAGAIASFVDRLGCDYLVLPAGQQRVATYCSLYFDTPDLAFFHAHRCGRRVRHKVRVRHYPDRELSVLEVKMRRSEHLTTKARMERRFGDCTLGPADLAFVRAHVASPAALLPQVWVSYRRLTLLGVHVNERVTIDVGVTAWRDARQARLRDVAIVEIKQPRLSRGSAAMTALRQLGGRPGGVSKYCAALVATRADLPANRVRSDVRALKRVGTWVS